MGDVHSMTSRTFPLSRQRRRRIAPKGVVPVQDGQRHAAPAEDDDLGDEVERAPAPVRTPSGEPADPATHAAGARPPAPRLPHEHDEHADPPQPPRDPIVQAEADLPKVAWTPTAAATYARSSRTRYRVVAEASAAQTPREATRAARCGLA